MIWALVYIAGMLATARLFQWVKVQPPAILVLCWPVFFTMYVVRVIQALPYFTNIVVSAWREVYGEDGCSHKEA